MNKKQKAILKDRKGRYPVINEFVETLTKSLKENDRVKVNGLGIFSIKIVKGREVINPFNKERHMVPAHPKIAFKPSKSFKDIVCN